MALVYKHYDQEALDKQYNMRAAVADFQVIVKSWQRRSEAIRRLREPLIDVCYGEDEREKCDIFPAARPSSPVYVFFHGGYWRAMDKAVFHFTCNGIAEDKAAVVHANYPLAPRAGMDDIVSSCRKCIVWLYRNASQYNGDPEKIHVCGHSAGGHIVAMLMATNWKRLHTDLPATLIRSGVALSGLFDLQPIRLSFLNEVLKMDEAAAERNSPILLNPVSDGPLMIAVGELESEEFHAQSRDFARTWSEKGVRLSFHIIPDADHFSILDRLADRNSDLAAHIRAQMGL